MLTIKANISTDDLLQAAKQLNEREMDAFIADIIAFQAKRKAPSLGHNEAVLIQHINTPLPHATQQRYNELIALRRAEHLSPEEHAELLRLTDEVAAFQAQRVTYLAQLAQLRGTTLSQVMADLGIKTPEYEWAYHEKTKTDGC